MQINIKARNFDISTELSEYTHKKLQKLDPYQEFIHDIQISFHQEHLSHIAEGLINVTGKTIVAKAESSNMQESMDALIDIMIRKLKKHREKTTEHR